MNYLRIIVRAKEHFTQMTCLSASLYYRLTPNHLEEFVEELTSFP